MQKLFKSAISIFLILAMMLPTLAVPTAIGEVQTAGEIFKNFDENVSVLNGELDYYVNFDQNDETFLFLPSMTATIGSEKYKKLIVSNGKQYESLTSGDIIYIDSNNKLITDRNLIKKLIYINLVRDSIAIESQEIIDLTDNLSVSTQLVESIGNNYIESTIGNAVIGNFKGIISACLGSPSSWADSYTDFVKDFGLDSALYVSVVAVMYDLLINTADSLEALVEYNETMIDKAYNYGLTYDEAVKYETLFKNCFADIKTAQHFILLISNTFLDGNYSDSINALNVMNNMGLSITKESIEEGFKELCGESFIKSMQTAGSFYNLFQSLYSSLTVYNRRDNYYNNHSVGILDAEEPLIVTVDEVMNAVCKLSGVNESDSNNSGSTSTYVTGTYKPSSTSGLYVRPGASTSSGDPIAAIPYGMSFVVTSINGSWGKTTYNGKTGWACLEYATYVGSSTTTPSTNQLYEIDVNGHIDGNYKTSLVGYVTFDVYINGSLIKNDVSDFATAYANGTSYEIKDIKAKSGYKYVSGTSLSGKINGEKVWVYLTLESVKQETSEIVAKALHQCDYSYAYSTSTVKSGGCALLALINALYYLDGQQVGVKDLATYAGNNGTYVANAGTNVDKLLSVTENCTLCKFKISGSTTNLDTLKNHLINGGVAIYGVENDLFYKHLQNYGNYNGHILAVVDYKLENGKEYFLFLDSEKCLSYKIDTADGSNDGVYWLERNVFDTYRIKENKFRLLSSSMPQKSITYNANGGSDAPTVQTAKSGATISLSTTIPTRNGYTFMGWATSSAATSATYFPGISYKITEDVTLYALWSSATNWTEWTDWKPEIPSATEHMQVEAKLQYGYYHYVLKWSDLIGAYPIDNATMVANGFNSSTETYHEYWSDSKLTNLTDSDGTLHYQVNGETKYFTVYPNKCCTLSGAPISSVAYYLYDLGKTRTLYRTRLAKFNIYYNANGGTNAPATQTTSSSLYLTQEIPVKENCTFLGWSTSPNGDVEHMSGGKITPTSNITLYAVWKPNDEITEQTSFVFNNHKYTYYDISLPWNSAKAFCESQDGNLVTITSDEERIALINNFGVTSSYWIGATDALEEGVWNWITGEDFVYTYWADNEPSNSDDLENYAGIIAGSPTAKWNDFRINLNINGFVCETDVPFVISYDANGGTGAPANQTKTHGTDLVLSSTVPTREGYSFKGWSTTPNGSAAYAPGATYTNDSDITLYAVWESNTVNATSITLNKSTLNLNIGDTDTLTATVLPTSATNKTVTWKSSNTNVATVNNGIVTAIGAGSTTITATTVDGNKTATCQVTVNAPAAEYQDNLYISADKVTSRAGEDVTVNINIKDNPGFAGLTLTMNYDSNVLEFVSSELDILAGAVVGSNVPGKIVFACAGVENINGDGVLVSLKFKVKENAAEGTYPVTLSFVDGDAFRYDGYDEILCGTTLTDGAVEIIEYVPGDANGDNTVNNRDAARILQYIAGWDVEIVQAGCDANGDGTINNRDAARILQYIAGWDVELH